MTPEAKVKLKVNGALARLVYPGTTRSAVYKFMPVQNGMGAPGLDYYLCINGKFVAIETKAKGKKPTPRQLGTMTDISLAGGPTFVVSDTESLAETIAIICNQCRVEYGPPND